MADFPSALPNFTDLIGSSTLAANDHAARHNKVHAELGALAAKVGITGSAVNTTIDFKLSTVTTGWKAETQANKSTSTGLSPTNNTLFPTNLAVKTYIDGQILGAVAAAKSQAKNELYPVGSIYTNKSNGTDPATLLGFGTWVALEGRFLVGVDPLQTEFDTANETGGTKTETLSLAQVPNATGSIVLHGGENSTIIAGWSGVFSPPETYGGGYKAPPGTTGGANSARYGINFNLGGGGGSHNNLPPYRAVYMWERTA